MPGFMNSG